MSMKITLDGLIQTKPLKLMRIIQLLILLSLPLICSAKRIKFRDGNYYPDSCVLNVNVTVVDTLKADSMFKAMKPLLWDEYDKGFERLNKCRNLISMQGKKVTASDELNFLAYAYDIARAYNPNLRIYKSKKTIEAAYLIPIVGEVVNSGRDGQRYEVEDKNIKKGKITSNVVKYLQCYSDYLTDSLNYVESIIESGWVGNINYENLPKKQIIVQMSNPYYRGFWYSDADTLDMIERFQQVRGWEFLYSENRKHVSESYPNKIEYYVYEAAPKYKVTYSYNSINEVYNSTGQLIYVPRLTRNNASEFNEIKRLVYLRDYQKNRYNIKTKSAHTQNFLRLQLERKDGFMESNVEALGAWGVAFIGGLFSPFSSTAREVSRKGLKKASEYADEVGKNYLNQLKKDHEADFGYIYRIKRISNTSFQVIYLNSKTLKPSYCATITYRTGKKRFTCDYSTKLVQIPSDVPVVKSNLDFPWEPEAKL